MSTPSNQLNMTDSLQVSIGQFSSPGPKEKNEDFYGAMFPTGSARINKGICVAIADGVSTCGYGREASEQCVASFLSDYYSTPDSWTVKKSGEKILGALNQWLYSAGQNDSKGNSYLSTFSVIIFKGTQAHIFHTGDSRIYHWHKQQLEPVTRDHRTTMSKNGSQLTRAMGADLCVEIDYRQLDIEVGDRFLLTTDGVHDFITHTELSKLVKTTDLHTAVTTIVEHAQTHDSDDNQTAQLVQLDSLPERNYKDISNRLSALPFPPELNVGYVLDGYRVVSQLYASSTSQLYKVIEPDTGDTLIMKTPSANYEDDANYRERFYLEEWAGKRIQHPNVCRVIVPKKNKSCLYVLLEAINGITLTQWHHENPTPAIETVQNFISQIGAGLQAFHRREMLHQDLKPDNIIVQPNGLLKIIDFGSVKIAGVAETGTHLAQPNMLGTVDYSAPELKRGGSGNQQSDIFSLGVITYYLLTGNLPYGSTEGGGDYAWKARKSVPYRSITTSNPMLPQWLDETLRKAVHPDLRYRYAELSEYLYDLNHPESIDITPARPIEAHDPVLFWKTISIVLATVCLVLIAKILGSA